MWNTHQIKLLFLECFSEDQIDQAKLLIRGLHICVSILEGFVASLGPSEEVVPSCMLLTKTEYSLWLLEVRKMNFSPGGLHRGHWCLRLFAVRLVILSPACVVGSQDSASTCCMVRKKGLEATLWSWGKRFWLLEQQKPAVYGLYSQNLWQWCNLGLSLFSLSLFCLWHRAGTWMLMPVLQGQRACENVAWEAVRVPLGHGLLHWGILCVAGAWERLWSNCRQHGNWANSKVRGIQKGF